MYLPPASPSTPPLPPFHLPDEHSTSRQRYLGVVHDFVQSQDVGVVDLLHDGDFPLNAVHESFFLSHLLAQKTNEQNRGYIYILNSLLPVKQNTAVLRYIGVQREAVSGGRCAVVR